MPAILDEHQQWFDELTGEPINAGYVYIGERNLDPQLNPQTIYSDRALTTPITNPQRTDSSGQTVNKIWVVGNYSIEVEDSANVQKYISLDNGSTEIDSGLESMSDLLFEGIDGQIEYLKDFHTGVDGASGHFEYRSSESRANHNGGTIIDPTNTADLATWDAAAKTIWFTAGTGLGCWIKLDGGTSVGFGYNPRWFGAKGDGVEDDDAAILAARNNGTTAVHISEGNYIYNTTLTPLAGQRIYGDGPAKTKLLYTGGGLGFEADGQGLDDWTFEGCLLDGSGATTPTGAIHTHGPDDFLIKNVWAVDWEGGYGCKVEGSAGKGSYYGTVTNFRITKASDTYSCTQGIIVEGATNLCNSHVFNQPKIYWCSSDASYLHACRAITFNHANFERNEGYAFNFDSNKSSDSTFIFGVEISGGYFEHNNQSGTETMLHSNSSNTIGVVAHGFRNVDLLKDGTWTGRGNVIFPDGTELSQMAGFASITDDDLQIYLQIAGTFAMRDDSATIKNFLEYIKSTGVLTLGNGGEINLRGAVSLGNYSSFTDTDTTPSVLGGSWFRANNTVATIITDFDDPVDGQIIYIYAANNNTTITSGTNIFLNGGTRALATREIITLIYNGGSGEWIEPI